MKPPDLFEKYFRGRPAFDDLEKATFAYHHGNAHHVNEHRFPSGVYVHTALDMPERIRNEPCTRCGRTRADVRWDDKPAACAASVGRPTIGDVLGREEEAFCHLLDAGSTKIPDVIGTRFSGKLDAAALFYLQTTVGYSPDIVACFVDDELEPLMLEFEQLMLGHKAKSGAFKGVKA